MKEVLDFQTQLSLVYSFPSSQTLKNELFAMLLFIKRLVFLCYRLRIMLATSILIIHHKYLLWDDHA
jgi:hypothetical protein